MLSPKQPDVMAPRADVGKAPPLQENFLPRANAQNLSVYFGNMRSLLNAGVGLIAALDEMSRSASSQSLRQASLQMKQQLSLGRSWSEAMKSFPALFAPMTVALIAAGEKSGNLVGICGELSEFAEQEYEIRETYRRDTWYPKVLLFFSTVVFPLPLVIVWWGTPVHLEFREQVLTIGSVWLLWLGANWLWPIGSRGKPRLVMDRWKLQIPLVRDITRGFAVAKVWRVLALLYSSGVSLPTALRIAASACGNEAFAQSLRDVAPRLERGETLSAVLTSTGEFPESALGLARTGEQSGDLDKVLSHSVRFIESEAKTKLWQTTKTIALLAFLLIAFKIGAQVVYFWTGTPIRIGG